MNKELILIPDFNYSIFNTKFFTYSLVLSEEVKSKLLFNNKHIQLGNKDKERDPNSKLINYIFIFNCFDRKTYLIDIDTWLNYSEDERMYIFKNSDIYIPRSIWFKAFAMLNKEQFPFLEEWSK